MWLTLGVAGQRLWPIEPGADRTALDYNTYGRRTMWDDIGIFNCGYEWREAANQLMATFKTIAFPAIVWATLLQTLFGITMGVTGQATSFALLAAGYIIHYNPLPYSRSNTNSLSFQSSFRIDWSEQSDKHHNDSLHFHHWWNPFR